MNGNHKTTGGVLVCTAVARLAGVFALVLLGVAGGPALAHTPTIDADLSDWCLFTTPRVEDSSATLTCAGDAEVVWWDAPADGAVNDLATVATTQDATNLYWAAELHVDPDPVSLPFAEIAIDVGPGGKTEWWDPTGALKTPGNCSVSTDRLCTTDADCHFCAISTIYTGTPNERPRPCGSTNMIDSCDDFNNADLCNRSQTCENIGVGPSAPDAGDFSSPLNEPDYLLVFDFSRWLLNFCDATKLLRNDSGTWVEIPRAVQDPNCPLATWHFLPAVDPGASGGSGGPPGKIELAVPWDAFVCAGCVPFGPGDEFRWSLEVNRGTLTTDYVPDLAIEDVMTEAIDGRTTTTTDCCNKPGTDTTLCEIKDGSMDAFVPLPLSGLAGGHARGLTVFRNTSGPTPSLTLDWGPSCSTADTDYEVYEGTLGTWYSHVPASAGGLCSTAGARSATFNAGTGNTYYLIVPRTGASEGSYGRDSAGAARPASTAPCLPQVTNACP